MKTSLQTLFERAVLWRGAELAQVQSPGVATGYKTLDALLPGGGWPSGALTELLSDQQGIGELQLLMPALQTITQQRYSAIISPPYTPYAPALTAQGLKLKHTMIINAENNKDVLWAMEQSLRSGTCGAVIAWPQMIDERALRRLQLAAEAGRALGFIYRPTRYALAASPAALRLRVKKSQQQLCIDILKRRGGGPTQLLLDIDSKHAVASRLPTRSAA
jgi:hypothetical protein